MGGERVESQQNGYNELTTRAGPNEYSVLDGAQGRPAPQQQKEYTHLAARQMQNEYNALEGRKIKPPMPPPQFYNTLSREQNPHRSADHQLLTKAAPEAGDM